MWGPLSGRRWSAARLKGGALKPASMLVPGRVLGEVEEYLIEHSCPAIASCSQVRSCDLKVCASSMPLSRAHTRQSPKCLLMRVASSRSRPNSPSGCACSSQSQNHGRDCQTRSQTGCGSKPMSQWSQAPTKSWSRPSRAERGITSSATRSRDGSPIRVSACCSAARTGRRRAVRLRRQRICARHLGAQRHGRDGANRAS